MQDIRIEVDPTGEAHSARDPVDRHGLEHLIVIERRQHPGHRPNSVGVGIDQSGTPPNQFRCEPCR